MGAVKWARGGSGGVQSGLKEPPHDCTCTSEAVEGPPKRERAFARSLTGSRQLR